MKKMMKVLSLALALVMTVSLLAACGGSGGDADAEEKPEVKIGITLYEPMNYKDENGELTGFETEFATAVFDELGMTPVFQEINWDSKVMEVNSKNINCIWNGMTATPEMAEALTLSVPYVSNGQVIIIRSENADKYKTTADLVSAKVDAEAGSAGEATLQADPDLSKATYTSVPKQVDALMEVKAGAADACVLDLVLANAMVGKGDYSDLMMIPDLKLSEEQYVVGFAKDDPLAEQVDGAIKTLYDNGKLAELAEKYGLALIEQK